MGKSLVIDWNFRQSAGIIEFRGAGWNAEHEELARSARHFGDQTGVVNSRLGDPRYVQSTRL